MIVAVALRFEGDELVMSVPKPARHDSVYLACESSGMDMDKKFEF